MLRTGHLLLVAASLLFATALAAGCGANRAAHPVEPGRTPPVTAPTNSTPDSRSGLPAPLSIKRGAATIQNVLLATDYLSPYVQNAVPSGTDLVLTADPGQPGPAGLAYAVYELTPDIVNDKIAKLVHLTWHGAPATAWMGIANFQTNRWNWQTLEAGYDTALDLPNVNADGSGHLLAVVLLTSGSGTLARVRYGDNEAPQVTLAISRPNAPMPFDLMLQASDAVDPDGSIVNIAFAPNGSGYVDNGLSPDFTFHAAQPGTFTAKLRVTDDEGKVSERSQQWSTSTYYIWDGGPAFDGSYLYDIAAIPSGGFYAVGLHSQKESASQAGLLVVRFAADGSIAWSKSLIMPTIGYESNCVLGPQDSVYVCCRTCIAGVAFDTELAKFDSDGTLAWQDSWGRGLVSARPFMLADNAAGKIYLGCRTKGTPDLLALTEFAGSDGSQLWSKTVNGADEGTSFFAAYGLAQDTAGDLCVAGEAYSRIAIDADHVQVTSQPAVAKVAAADGSVIAASQYGAAAGSAGFFAGGGGGPLALTLKTGVADQPGPSALGLLLLNDDLSVASAKTVSGVDPTPWSLLIGELNVAPDGSFWYNSLSSSNNAQLCDLLHFSASGAVLSAQFEANSYLTALTVKANGNPLLAGFLSFNLPQWQPKPAVSATDFSVTPTTLDLTDLDWDKPLVVTTYPVDDAVPATHPASGGLVYEVAP